MLEKEEDSQANSTDSEDEKHTDGDELNARMKFCN